MSNVEIFPPRDAVDDEVFDSNQLWVAPVENDEPLPDKFLTPPFKNLRATKAWLDGSAAKTHPVISLLGAFHIAQTASARKYRSSNDNQLFLLLCVIARTGAGKDSIVAALLAHRDCLQHLRALVVFWRRSLTSSVTSLRRLCQTRAVTRRVLLRLCVASSQPVVRC